MKTKLLIITTLCSLLFALCSFAETYTTTIDATDTQFAAAAYIQPGSTFAVAIGGDTSSSDWNSVEVDLQVKVNAEWVTITDFNNVTVATVIMIEFSPGSQWRFNVTGGTAPSLKAYIITR